MRRTRSSCRATSRRSSDFASTGSTSTSTTTGRTPTSRAPTTCSRRGRGLSSSPSSRSRSTPATRLTYLPRAGEQLSSLSLTNQSLDPERFTNYEVGAKWDLQPGLSFTTAIYRLDRTNVVVPDPTDASRSILVDGARTKGVEVGLSGRLTPAWTAVGGYAYQDGRITNTLSASARNGAKLAEVPTHTFSLWNRYDVSRRWGAGAGIIHNADMFTSTDNTVRLPAFTRVDGAVFVNLTRAAGGAGEHGKPVRRPATTRSRTTTTTSRRVRPARFECR